MTGNSETPVPLRQMRMAMLVRALASMAVAILLLVAAISSDMKRSVLLGYNHAVST